jgi:processing peptidase subunit alpha
VGGMVTNERPLQEPFVKVAIAFNVGGWKDDRLVICCVLQQLLGGGSSFSAGGPGKGMYTRLYREMLNQHHWVESAESFLVIHDDAGLLGIDGACAPEYVKELIREIVYHLARLCVEPVSDEELSRAKNMLKSMMLMQLESRLILCEDIARQFVIYGKRSPPEEICAKIDAITQQDLMSLAQNMLSSNVSVGCAGHDLSHVPQYDDINAFVQQMKAVIAQRGGR